MMAIRVVLFRRLLVAIAYEWRPFYCGILESTRLGIANDDIRTAADLLPAATAVNGFILQPIGRLAINKDGCAAAGCVPCVGAAADGMDAAVPFANRRFAIDDDIRGSLYCRAHDRVSADFASMSISSFCHVSDSGASRHGRPPLRTIAW